MAQTTEHFKAPEKIQLNKEEIANLSDAQFKTLVIKKLTELVEFGHKLEERVKAMQSEIKKNAQGTNSEGTDTGTQQCGPEGRNKHSIRTELRDKNSKKLGEAYEHLGQL